MAPEAGGEFKHNQASPAMAPEAGGEFKHNQASPAMAPETGGEFQHNQASPAYHWWRHRLVVSSNITKHAQPTTDGAIDWWWVPT